MPTVHETNLWYTAGSSDKEYHARIDRDADGTFSVPFRYGRRYSATSGGFKVQGQTYRKARITYVTLIKTKMRKGYVRNGSGQPMDTDMTIEEWEASVPMSPEAIPSVVAHNPAEHIEVTTTVTAPKKESRPAPQLLNMIEEDEMKALIKDSEFGAQEKYDGKRMTLEWKLWNKRDNIKAFNKKGESCPVPDVIANQFKNTGISDFRTICQEEGINTIILDGEFVDNKYYVFDILSYDRKGQHVVLRGKGYKQRHTTLHNLFMGKTTDYLQLAPLAETTAQKEALLNRLRKNGGEGIVFKKLNAPYTSGRPNTGGDQLKFKFYATASVIINRVNDKNSVNMMVLDENGHEVIVGNCTVPAKVKKDLYEGQVIEVRYLYAYKGGSLYQPTYLGIRDDVDNDECVIRQLKYKGEGEADNQPVLMRKILWED